ncbi:hypothetical protein HQ545_05710 [Candidatus Woesearchaeota archaeon]|nr:hypothetical protein [Candidatus Woesearchaeota archaeon]
MDIKKSINNIVAAAVIGVSSYSCADSTSNGDSDDLYTCVANLSGYNRTGVCQIGVEIQRAGEISFWSQILPVGGEHGVAFRPLHTGCPTVIDQYENIRLGDVLLLSGSDGGQVVEYSGDIDGSHTFTNVCGETQYPVEDGEVQIGSDSYLVSEDEGLSIDTEGPCPEQDVLGVFTLDEHCDD